jgi:hypothetical protein
MMKLKYMLALATALTAGSAMSYAATIPACVAGALSGVYTNSDGSSNGFTCETNDKIFSNFVYTTAGADPDAAQVSIGIDSNPGIFQSGFQFNSAVSGLVWETPGFSLAFTVTVDQSACATLYGAGDTCTITGGQGQFQGAFSSNAATMVDTLTPGGTINLDGLNPGDNTKNLTLAPQPITATNILISGTNSGASDPIDSFGLDIYQTVSAPASGVPEPATFSLMGVGLVGLGLVRRRLRK